MNEKFNAVAEARKFKERGNRFSQIQLAVFDDWQRTWSIQKRFGFFDFLLILICLGAVLELQSTAAVEPEQSMSPFTVGGGVTTEAYGANGSNTIFKMESSFVFSWSNGWWQVESTYGNNYYPSNLAQETVAGTVLNCRLIPDGVRFFVVPPNNGGRSEGTSNEVLTAATVEPQEYPPFAHAGLFAPWLSLCPKPELPTTESRFIKRFYASIRSLNHPKNLGEYTAEYLQPEKIFLSELNISNNGTIFRADGNQQQLSGVFEKGYKEFNYTVIETTNVNGKIFPSRTVLNRLSPAQRASSRDDVRPFSATRLNVEWVEYGIQSRVTTSPKLVALDTRPSGLKPGVTMNYLVTNDQWLALTNRRMEQLAKVYRQQQPVRLESNSPRSRIVILTILVLVSVVPVAGFLWYRKNNNKTKRKQ